MTKKELEKKVADLEAKVAELTSAMLALSLRQIKEYVFLPAQQPVTVPNVPYTPYPYPYIGDPVPGTPGYSTITCGTNVLTSKGSGNFQIFQ